MQNNKWAQLLAYITGMVNQRLLLFLAFPNATSASRSAWAISSCPWFTRKFRGFTKTPSFQRQFIGDPLRAAAEVPFTRRERVTNITANAALGSSFVR
jgi:hypothetical protein